MTIAVVGTGIAGLSAAHVLARHHDVVLYEANGYAGGHTNTVDVDGTGIDTGFIVHNRRNYPLLTRLFDELAIEARPTTMSFSVSCACGVEWSSRRPWRAGRLLGEILGFLRTAGRVDVEGKTFGEFLRDEGYSESFRRHYLVPMTGALWSSGADDVLGFPAELGIAFFRNHGMLGLRRERWRTVVGGSSRYVDALLERSRLRVRLGCPVRAIERMADGVVLRLDDGESATVDGVVVATHAPTALGLLARPTELERRLLSVFRVTENETVLHCDERLLPTRRSNRSAWNTHVSACGAGAALPTVTYSLTRLQGLKTDDEWSVSLNRTAEIDPAKVRRVLRYAHPVMTRATLAAQPELARLNDGRIAFAGAWHGFGFHEDGIRSGVAAARSFGVDW